MLFHRPPDGGPSAQRRYIDTAVSGLRRRIPATVALASVLLFLSSLLWAVLVPDFRAPDELQHVNSVVRVAEGGGWPRPGDVRIEDETLRALQLSGAIAGGPRTVLPGAAAFPPGAPSFTDVVPTGVADRKSFRELDHGPEQGGPIDQMTQHPPGYYGIAAAVYDLAGAGEWRYDRAIFLLRAISAFMVAATVPVCCYVAARELSGRESVGRIAAFVPLFIPEVQYIAGAVSNDGMTIAATSVIWALLLKITCSGPSRRRLLALSVAIAVAFWTKGTALALLPSVPFAIALAYSRARPGSLRTWGRPALTATAGVLGLAFVLGGWWWALNVVRFGRIQPAAYLVPKGSAEPMSVLQFLRVFVGRIRWSFFGDLGVFHAPAVNAFTGCLAALFTVLCVAGVVSRQRLADRLVMLLGVGSATGVLFTAAYRAHLESHNLPGLQGRYLFVLLVPVAVFFAVGLVRLVRLPSAWLLPGVALAGLGITVQGAMLGFRLYYADRGRSWGDAVDRFFGWAAWSPTVIAGLLAMLVIAGLALVWLLARESATDAGVRSVPGAFPAETDVGTPERMPAGGPRGRLVAAPVRSDSAWP